MFDVQEGAHARNVIIGPLAADGIHCLGNCTLDRVWWQDIGEDAATALGPAGTVMNITCGAAYNGSDKTFQFNGRGEMRISNFYVANAGKLVRSCGDCTGNGGPRRISVNNVITRDVPTIVGINTNFGDVATIRNLTLNNSGTTKTKICQVYKGVVKGPGQYLGAGRGVQHAELSGEPGRRTAAAAEPDEHECLCGLLPDSLGASSAGNRGLGNAVVRGRACLLTAFPRDRNQCRGVGER